MRANLEVPALYFWSGELAVGGSGGSSGGGEITADGASNLKQERPRHMRNLGQARARSGRQTMGSIHDGDEENSRSSSRSFGLLGRLRSHAPTPIHVGVDPGFVRRKRSHDADPAIGRRPSGCLLLRTFLGYSGSRLGFRRGIFVYLMNHGRGKASKARISEVVWMLTISLAWATVSLGHNVRDRTTITFNGPERQTQTFSNQQVVVV